MSVKSVVALLSVVSIRGHDVGLPVNPVLGVPGFPDCVRAHPEVAMSVDDAAMDLVCTQRGSDQGSIKVGCVGDSITAGVHSSGGVHPYPAQLQLLLDAGQGNGTYSVTNMGASGSMMLKNGSKPFWKRPQFKTLTENTWDVIIIMLGTNDANNAVSDWNKDCGGPNSTSLENCTFADDFASMVKLVKTLGTTPSGPKVYVMTPPPLMQYQDGNPALQTTINTLFPKLIPLMQEATPGLLGPIDVYTGFGGTPDWPSKFPSECVLNSPWPFCKLWCDAQICGQCHPDDNGYVHMAKLVYAGLGFK